MKVLQLLKNTKDVVSDVIWTLSAINHRDITKNEAEFLLKRELRTTENAVARMVASKLTENQFSAICCLVYNVGSGRFRSSTIRMKLNRKDYIGASNEFWKWRRAGGKILKGLVRRRAEEKGLFDA